MRCATARRAFSFPPPIPRRSEPRSSRFWSHRCGRGCSAPRRKRTPALSFTKIRCSSVCVRGTNHSPRVRWRRRRCVASRASPVGRSIPTMRGAPCAPCATRLSTGGRTAAGTSLRRKSRSECAAWRSSTSPEGSSRSATKMAPSRWSSTARSTTTTSCATRCAPAAIGSGPESEDDATEHLRELLGQAVTSHLESEVPLGAFLSGGLDSSTVVALMAGDRSRPPHTFAIGFAEQAYNEAPHARRAAAALGTRHTDLEVVPAADRFVDSVVGLFDEPFADASALPTYLVARLARTEVTVSLSGDGGDELFGGYTRYLDVLKRPQVPGWGRPFLRTVGRALPHVAPGRGRLLDLARTRPAAYAGTVALPLAPADGGMAAPLLVPREGEFGDLFAGAFEEAAVRDFTSQMMLVDVATYLPGDILTKVDRASMAVSLEARVPLLDHPLVEFALGLPAGLKIRDGVGKRVFRQAIRGLVPPEVMDRPKHGFSVPLGSWFRGPLRHRIDALTLPRDGVGIYDFLDRRAVSRLASEHLMRRRDHSTALWRALVLQLWLGHLDAGRLARSIPALPHEPAEPR